MLGSSAILALSILAASPETSRADDAPNGPVMQLAFPEPPKRETVDKGREAAETPRRLPPDPAYDHPVPLLAHKERNEKEHDGTEQKEKENDRKEKDEGILGLPTLEESPPTKATEKPAEKPPAAKKEKPNDGGEAKLTPKPETKPPEEKAKPAEEKAKPAAEKTKPAEEKVAPPEKKATPTEEKHPEVIERPETKKIVDRNDMVYVDEPPDDACEVVHGRPRHRNCCRTWFDGIDVDAWLDQGATINDLSPRDRTNGPVTFNNRSNEYQLNQLYLRLKRDVNTEGDLWDFGGRVDLLYGSDSIYTEARGLELNDDLSPKWNAQQYGLALPQAYAEIFCPWGAGLDMKLGHFYSGFGYESVEAPANFFYSHSYVFQYGEPKTYTGLIGESHLGDLMISAGLTRGWDNWDDNNDDLSFTGGIGWESCDRRTRVTVNVDAGRQQDDPSDNVRTLYSLVVEQKIGQCWQYVLQNDYGSEPAAGVDGRNAEWYGINQYLFRQINECWKAGMRFEWFRDINGSRVPNAGRTGDYYELTAGANWTPSQHVVVRPEIRWDWCGTPDLLPYGDGTRSNQLLLDCDVIVRF